MSPTLSSSLTHSRGGRTSSPSTSSVERSQLRRRVRGSLGLWVGPIDHPILPIGPSKSLRDRVGDKPHFILPSVSVRTDSSYPHSPSLALAQPDFPTSLVHSRPLDLGSPVSWFLASPASFPPSPLPPPPLFPPSSNDPRIRRY